MAKAAICFSDHDAAFAAELGKYLEQNTSVYVELAECEDPHGFLDVIEQCLGCEMVVVVLSKAAVPRLWPRAEWERVLVPGANVSYLEREGCPFPLILKRRAYFDSPAAVRQWIIQTLKPERRPPSGCPGEQDHSLLPLLDQPGVMSGVKRGAADWFVANYWRWFENVCRVECASATRAGVLGEIAHALGLQLAGTVEQNWEALRNYARQERTLYVFENLSEEFRELAELGGKSSVLILAEEEPTAPVTIEQLKDMFFSPGADEAACLRMLGRFLSGEPVVENWADMKAIGFRARLFFQKEMRLAEAHELLVWLAALAKKNDDWRALADIQREENWILNAWDLPLIERTESIRTEPSQMWLY
jgi:hypothetical protein